MTPTIDAHVHVWDASRVHYPRLAETPGLRPAYGLSDVHDEPRDAGVDGVVLVQAADDPADTDLMLDVARDHDIVAGVVAWAPLVDSPEVARHPAVSCVLLGMRSEREVDENVDRYETKVPEGIWPDLVSAGLIDADVPELPHDRRGASGRDDLGETQFNRPWL